MHEAYSHRLDGMTDMDERSSQLREEIPFRNKFTVETASGGSFEDLLMTSMEWEALLPRTQHQHQPLPRLVVFYVIMEDVATGAGPINRTPCAAT
jgi:hypothetical protein